MRLKANLLKPVLAAAVILGLSATALAQSSSINTFSPYSMFGVGDFINPGQTSMRSMGGVGLGFRSPTVINYLNPASYNAVNPKSALLSLGMQGDNYYLKDSRTTTSYNSFNVRDIAFQIPVYKNRVGVAFSLNPYSNVGYRISDTDEDSAIGAEIGRVKYAYTGSGGITQFKLGVGVGITDNISLGVEAVYYHGTINRDFDAEFTPIVASGKIRTVNGYSKQRMTKLLPNFGLQANLVKNSRNLLTFGATYQMGGKMNGTITREVPAVQVVGSGGNAIYQELETEFSMPNIFSGGLYYERNNRYALGVDYSYAMWGDANAGQPQYGIGYRNTSSVKLGGSYTPNAMDVRYFLNRWTYRLGARYSQYYMNINGHQIDEMAVTFGFGIPLNSASNNKLDVGFELGTRGTTDYGLIKENYFRISIGISLFGSDYWFRKPLYD